LARIQTYTEYATGSVAFASKVKQGMLRLTKKADYGLMALKFLAERADTPSLSAKDIAEAYGIPPQLLAKILQRLTKAG
jgi:DNA-binding MarR family transcriptional regulator